MENREQKERGLHEGLGANALGTVLCVDFIGREKNGTVTKD
jgi:hypothetical protein